MRGNILVIDDEEEIFDELKDSLKAHNVYHTRDLTGINDRITRKKIDLVLVDLDLSGEEKSPDGNRRMSGLEFIHKLRYRFPQLIILVLSKYTYFPLVFKAGKDGADDYKWKDTLEFDSVEFREEIKKWIKLKKNRDEHINEIKTDIVGASLNTKNLKQQIDQLAKNRKSFVLLGEAGVEKDAIIHYLHYKSVFYTEVRELVTLDVSCHQPDDILDEIQNSFNSSRKTFLKQAKNNVCHIKSIHLLPLEIQEFLLPIIKDNLSPKNDEKLHIQFVISLEKDPQILIQEKKILRQLYATLAPCITIDPLRDRKDDIEPLMRSWMEVKEFPLSILTEEVINVFTQYNFPGNEVELYKFMESMMDKHILQYAAREKWKKYPIEFQSIPRDLTKKTDDLSHMNREIARTALTFIERALKQYNGRKGDAAEALNITSGADNLKKSYITKYLKEFPELFKQFPMIVKCYNLDEK